MNDDSIEFLKYYDKSKENTEIIRDMKLVREFGTIFINLISYIGNKQQLLLAFILLISFYFLNLFECSSARFFLVGVSVLLGYANLLQIYDLNLNMEKFGKYGIWNGVIYLLYIIFCFSNEKKITLKCDVEFVMLFV